MNHEVISIILTVIHLIGTKRYISDCHIKKIIWIIGLFKSFDLDIGIRIQQHPNSSADAVKFHAIQIRLSQFFWKHSKEISNSHGRFQNISFFKTEIFKCLIHTVDNNRLCVMGIQCRFPGCSILFRGKQCFQFLILPDPGQFILIKSIGQTAPSHISG